MNTLRIRRPFTYLARFIKKLAGFYALPLYILKRPFDGFYMMKYQKKGIAGVAAFNFLALSASFSFMNQYSSIVVNKSYPMGKSSLADLTALLIALVLFCVSNWSITCLTDGEGRLGDVFMTVCYAMTPMVLVFIPATLISNILAEGEGAFFFMLVGVSVCWFILLTFFGLVTIHNYMAGKALLTMFLTIIALLIIVFLIVLLVTLYQQLVNFVMSIYTELAYRY